MSTALGERHRLRQHRLAEVVGGRLAGMLGALPDLSDEQLARYMSAAYPTVRGGQAHAAQLSAAYIATLLHSRRVQRDLTGALEESGVAVAADSRSLVAPVLRARSLVGEGTKLGAALVVAGSYAKGLSSNDLQAASRVGLDTASRGERVGGWTKDVNPECCDWCQEVGDGVYASADSVPFHDNDRCSVSPV